MTVPVGAAGDKITVNEKTEYPFDGAVELKVTADKPVSFPLYVRIPAWGGGCDDFGERAGGGREPVPGLFSRLSGRLSSGDTVSLNFPMEVQLETPVADGVSLVRGPLVYALKIGRIGRR